VLQPDLWAEWLAPTTSASDARALLDVPVPDLEWYPVSAAVSTATTEGPQLIQPVS